MGQGQIGQAALVVAMHPLRGQLAGGTVNRWGSRLQFNHDAFGGDLGSTG